MIKYKIFVGLPRTMERYKFYHHDVWEGIFYTVGTRFNHIREEVLEYAGRRIIAEEYSGLESDRSSRSTLVPGYLIGELKGHTGVLGRCSLVELVGEQSKDGIRSLLREHKFAEPIKFWDDSVPAGCREASGHLSCAFPE